MKKYNCLHCKKEINFKEKYVELNTYNKGKNIEQVYYHIQCWSEYFNNCLNKKMQVILEEQTKQIGVLMNNPTIKNLMGSMLK